MRVKSVALENFRAFERLPAMSLANINVLIGPNNAGKSSIIRALCAMQTWPFNFFPDVRLGATQANIRLELADLSPHGVWPLEATVAAGLLLIQINSDQGRTGGGIVYTLSPNPGTNHNVPALPARAPNHFIVAYLSKRKTAAYSEDVREQFALDITPHFANLAAKLARVGNGTFPGYEAYATACKRILGFVVTAVPSAGGQRPGAYLSDGQTLPIEQMGEGVPQIAGMLADLVLAKGKLFLIEEPENDLHPQALKGFLELIVMNRPRFSRHLAAILYGKQGGSNGTQTVHRRIQA